MKSKYCNQSLFIQYLFSFLSIVIIAGVCYVSNGVIDYRSVGLLLLATVSMLAIFFTLFPVLLAATFSALIWEFFFIPPNFTFHIESSEDVLMLSMYFIVALVVCVLTSKVRHLEKLALQKDERANTLKLYKTLFNSILHELRTPNAKIAGATNNLLQHTIKMSEGDQPKLFNEISIAAFRLNRLVDNLLNMLRLESGLLEAKLGWCELNDELNFSDITLKETIHHEHKNEYPDHR